MKLNGDTWRRVVSTTIGILLAGLVAGGFATYQKVGQVLVKQEAMSERLNRIESRLGDLEREGRSGR